MGIYSDYLNANLSFDQVSAERKKQLKRISAERGGRDILVYAADYNKGGKANISIEYSDLLPVNDQLANLSGDKLDLIIETPGGSGEVAEDIVNLLHDKYEEIGIIIPGWAKSAGTIIALSGDEILMGKTSGLGPIDAQLNSQGRNIPAHALIKGFEKIKKEVEEKDKLNKAYIPILQGISPGELENAQRSLDFAKILVKDWLVKYKFKNWVKHSSSGKPVTDEEKKTRAKEIAKELCDHNHWKTHGRSLKISNLEEMGLKITDYSESTELNDAITRYYTLLQMTFNTNIYKVIETIDAQIFRFTGQQPKKLASENLKNVLIDLQCNKCNNKYKIQANFEKDQKLKPGAIDFPKDNKFICPNCKSESNISDVRRDIESQLKKTIL